MTRKKGRQIRIRGNQRAEIEPDLMAQIVLMLARQLVQETMTDESPVRPDTQPPADGPEDTSC